jgi:hypothetical protein
VIGDTDEPGGWVNGLHGLLALVVLLQVTVLTVDGARHVYPRGGSYPVQDDRTPPPRDAS